ncbi:hypothetical protein [Variovorax sp. YR752]|uniref:hypothetical protein n=1 Tax=Variovorax sp. YR752 TaxID=1884383 RepID=UPI003137BCF5
MTTDIPAARLVLRHSWSAPALLTAGALLTTAVSVWWWSQARQEKLDLVDELGRAKAVALRASRTTAEASILSTDFARRLPSAVQVDPVVSELQRAAAAAGVLLREVQFHPQAATPERLGQTEMTISLEGRYPKVKQVVGELLARYSHVTLLRFSASRVEAADDAEFSLTLTIWARPALVSFSGGGRD